MHGSDAQPTSHTGAVWNFQHATVMCFVDFASAFDSVDRDSLWQIMAVDGMPPKLSRLIKAYYASTKVKVRASGSDSMPFEIRSGGRKGCALSPTRFSYIIDWILVQSLQDYPWVQVGANIHEFNLAYADDIVILSSSCSKMQGLLEAVNCHAAAVGMRINASKTKVLSALIHGDQRLEDVDKFKYLGSMIVANGQGTGGIRRRINLARSAFTHLQSCFWS